MLERGQHLASKQLADFIWYEGSRHQISWPFAFIWERTECAVLHGAKSYLVVVVVWYFHATGGRQ